MKPGEGIAGKVFLSGEIYQSQDFLTDPNTRESTRALIPTDWGGVCVPLRAGQEVVGVFFVSIQSPRQLSRQEIHLIGTIAEIAGSAIHRAQLNTMLQRHCKRLLALRAIDSAISASPDLRLTLTCF
jgi:GAF domain-containing protein